MLHRLRFVDPGWQKPGRRSVDGSQAGASTIVRGAGPLMYAEHVDGLGTALFEKVCELDLEGIVAKQKHAPYVSDRESSTWFKVLNPE